MEEIYDQCEEEQNQNILLVELRDKFDELIDLWNEADDNEYLSRENIRELISLQIDIMDVVIANIRALDVTLKIIGSSISGMKNAVKGTGLKEPQKEQIERNNMFL